MDHRRYTVWLFGLLLSLPCLIYGAWLAYCENRIQYWPTTQATVLSFDPGVQDDGDCHWYANPQIRYAYTIDGQRYESTRLRPSPFNYQSDSRFGSDTALLRPDAHIEVCYDSSDPRVAYAVYTGVTGAPVWLLTIGTMLVLFTALASRDKRKSQLSDSA